MLQKSNTRRGFKLVIHLHSYTAFSFSAFLYLRFLCCTVSVLFLDGKEIGIIVGTRRKKFWKQLSQTKLLITSIKVPFPKVAYDSRESRAKYQENVNLIEDWNSTILFVYVFLIGIFWLISTRIIRFFARRYTL